MFWVTLFFLAFLLIVVCSGASIKSIFTVVTIIGAVSTVIGFALNFLL